MRLWSIHPKYLDAKGLVALWRESLLAQACLAGKTKGYYNHPQLNRFKSTPEPTKSIGNYLALVWEEASRRGYNFNRSKILSIGEVVIPVNTGQISYEMEHLRHKLEVRDPAKLKENNMSVLCDRQYEVHTIFKCVEGSIENWEKLNA